jgi:hypothetical protein
MITLALYNGHKRVAQWPLSLRQDMDTLGEALNVWIASAGCPRVVLEQGNVARIVRIDQKGG